MKELAQNTGTVIDHIVTLISKALEQAGVVVSHVYLVLVRQQFLYGIQEALQGLFYILAGVIAYRFYTKVTKRSDWDSLDRQLLIALLLIIVIGSLITGAGHIVSSVTRLFNPEYYAIQDGLRMLNEIHR